MIASYLLLSTIASCFIVSHTHCWNAGAITVVQICPAEADTAELLTFMLTYDVSGSSQG